MSNAMTGSSSDGPTRAPGRGGAAALPKGGSPPARDDSGYLPFLASAVAPPPPEPKVPPRLPPLDFLASTPAEVRTARLVEWCREAASAEAALAVDVPGGLLAASGPLPPSEATDLGARLVAALEQVRQMAPEADPPPALAVDFGPVWLTAFHVFLSRGSGLTLGLVAREPVPADLRDAISRTLREVL